MTLLERIIISVFDIRGLIPAVKVALVILIPYAIYLVLVAVTQWENVQLCTVLGAPMFFWWSC